LTFSYKSNFFYSLNKHRSFGFADFTASIGGLIGLIAGISIISLVEFVYFITFKAIKKLSFRKFAAKVYPENSRRNRTIVVPLNQDHVLYQFSRKQYSWFVLHNGQKTKDCW
jgi:Amiloride-sensitive sodium channel